MIIYDKIAVSSTLRHFSLIKLDIEVLSMSRKFDKIIKDNILI